MEIQELQKEGIKRLKQAGIPEARQKANRLLAHLLNLDLVQLIMKEKEMVTKKQQEIFFSMVQRLLAGEPIQYILQNQEFMGLPFYITPDVLIPQPDTEILVEEVLNLCNERKNYRILDLCTGSGAIGISLAKYLEKCNVTLSDISNLALEVAQENSRIHEVENKIKIIQSDMFKNINGKFDIVVSNPPYIETNVIHTLAKDVQNEPIIALDGGKDGLNFYRDISQNAYKFLDKNGYLCLEIGYQQKNKIINILEETKKYENIYYKKDLSGNNRVIIAKVG